MKGSKNSLKGFCTDLESFFQCYVRGFQTVPMKEENKKNCVKGRENQQRKTIKRKSVRMID